MSYVACPARITSPAPPPGFTEATGLGANHPCGLHVQLTDELATLVRAGAPLLCRCARGHKFYVAPGAVEETL